jgi:hypothetical protein
MFKMVDVCGGKMTLKELNEEICNYMQRSPKRLIVDIRLVEDGYHATVWISQADFEKGC